MKKVKRLLAFLMSLFLVFSVMPGNLLQVDAAKKKTVKVKTVKLNKKSVSLVVGEKVTLKATLSPKNTTQKKLVWSTSNKKVATVTSKGVVKAKKKGNATITVKVKGTSKKATCKVTVKTPVKVKKVALDKKSVSLQEGTSTTLKAKFTPKNTTQKTLQWSTSNKNIATVSANGVVTAVKVGTVTITAKVKGTSKKATCKVTVTAKPQVKVTNLAFTEANKTLKQGDVYQTKLNVTPATATNKAATYTSNNTSVASVDANGKVTAKAPGDTVIIATAKDGSGKKATMKVHVEFVEVRYVLTHNKNFDLVAIMCGDNRSGNNLFDVFRHNTYYCYNKKTSVNYKENIIGNKKQQTISVMEVMPGRVFFSVYSDEENVDNIFAKADAQVEVWKGNKKLATYKAPNKSGFEWLISSYATTTGEFVEYNQIGQYGQAEEIWYGDLKVTGFQNSKYIDKAEVGFQYIELYTSDEDFWENGNKYTKEIVPIYSNPTYTYTVGTPGQGAFQLRLKNANGTERLYFIRVRFPAYEELEITKCYSKDDSLIKSEMDDYSINMYGISESLDVNQIVVECKNSNATYEIVESGKSVELLITHPNGSVQRSYSIYYNRINPELEVTDINTTDNAVLDYTCTDYDIHLQLNKEMSLGELEAKLQISFKGKDVHWEIESEMYESARIQFTDANENTVSYWLYYDVDYDVMYGDLQVGDIQSTDSRFLGYSFIDDTEIYIFGTADSFADIKNRLQIICKQKGATYKIQRSNSWGDYQLVLTGTNGQKRRYYLHYVQDTSAQYGFLEVVNITDSDSILTSVSIDNEYSVIELYGKEWSLDTFKDKLSVKIGESNATYTLVYDYKEWSEECWSLILKGTNGATRDYEVYYYMDYDAHYGDFGVEEIICEDDSLADYDIFDNWIWLYGVKDSFEDIKDLLSIKLGDATAEWEFEFDDEWDEWLLVLSGNDKEERVYSISYDVDDEVYYANLYVADITSEDGSLVSWEHDGNDYYICITGTKDSFEDIKDMLSVKLGDATAKWEFEFDDERDEWLLVLSGADGKRRYHPIEYQVDYEERNKAYEIESIVGEDNDITKWQCGSDWIHIYGKKDAWIGHAVENLTVTMKNSVLTASIKYLKDEISWYLCIYEADELQKKYELYYSCDYNACYGTLKAQYITCSDFSLSSYAIGDNWISITGTKSGFEQIKDSLTVILADKKASAEFVYEDGNWRLLIKGTDGSERIYDVDYLVDYEELEVIDLTYNNDSITYYWIYQDSISIYGTSNSFGAIKDSLKVILADDTISYKFVSKKDEEVGSEYWQLVLTGSDKKQRIYEINYYFDNDAYYGDFYVEDITGEDSIITECYIDNADNYIILYGIAEEFRDIKDSLNIMFADELASYEFTCDVDEDYGTEFWKLVLTGTDGKERIYDINYYTDYEVRAEICEIESIAVEGVTITNWKYDGNWLEIYGMEEAWIGDIVDELTIELKDSSLKTSIEHSEESNSWNLIITRSDGIEMTYLMDYSFDYDFYYGDLCVKEITGDEYNYIAETYVYIYGTEESFEQIKDSLTIVLKDTSAKWEFVSETDEDSEYVSWKLVLTGEDGTQRTYDINYYQVSPED